MVDDDGNPSKGATKLIVFGFTDIPSSRSAQEGAVQKHVEKSGRDHADLFKNEAPSRAPHAFQGRLFGPGRHKLIQIPLDGD